ncbi:CDI toxin immunity protein [Bacillus mycoides]|uniref:CDI toxin immunity protein n=1 Tax=Bacillus TaxID=1386 RepID=UPI003F4DD80A
MLYANSNDILRNIDDVTAVGSDTYLFCPNNFVIEFYHEGEIIIGFGKDRI